MATNNLSLSQRSHGLHPWTTLRDEMMDFFDRFSHDNFPRFDEETFMPRIDVLEKGNTIEVRAEVPGMSDKDINVSLRDNQLVIEGEKKNESTQSEKDFYQSEISYGQFYRSIPLKEEVDPDKVEATYKDGVLCVSLQMKPETQTNTRKIPISSGIEKRTEGKH